jgi:ATP-dependent RNA helicase RhlE
MKALFGINVLIATPGRLLDLHNRNALKLHAIRTLVIDEADKMLHLGFQEEMDAIFKLLPAMRQNALFSATLNNNVEEVTAIVLRQPAVISVEDAPEQEEAEIEQRALRVSNETKGPMLRYLIKHYEMDQVLVFVESSFKADNVVKKLKKNGILAAAIHGKKSQGSRTDSLVKFKNKNINVLVATDLLARGIDINALPTVINYDLPRSPKDYVHRIGRTGRAGKSGLAFSLIRPEDQAHFIVIQKKMGKWVTSESTSDINLQGY